MHVASGVHPLEVLRILQQHRRLWIVPAVAGCVLALAYIAVRTPTWQASQALALRNEAANNSEGPGRFRQPDDLKVTQETLLEVAKSHNVLAAALREARSTQSADFQPTSDDVEDLRDALSLTPPKGSEFGKTEIVYLKVKSKEPAQALKLVSAICRNTQLGLQNLRQTKAQSMIDELARAAALAQTDLRQATAQLAAMESSVGCDLGELRMLEMSATADSDLRRKLTQIDTELRESHTTQQTNQELLDLLRQARLDPEQFLATPNKLLESQPALRRLKEGLVDAELRTANLLGTMTDDHPLVTNARWMQREVRERLHGEIDTALRGVELDLRLAESRRQMLLDQAADARRRLDRLAGMRADYSMLAAQVRQRTALVEEAQKDLADARACQAGAVASLISPLDAPELGSRPVGPGNLVILLAGAGSGLLLGLGLVYLMVQPAPAEELAAGRSDAAHDRLPAAGAATAIGARYRSPFAPAARREVLSLNDALLTLAQRNTIIRRRA